MKHTPMLGCVLAFACAATFAQTELLPDVRDPFAPAVGAGLSVPGDPGTGNAPPMLRYPADEYQLIGILTSKNQGIGIVQTPAGARYYVRKGDALGADGYVVTDMKLVSIHLKTHAGQPLILTAKSAGGSE